MTENETKVRVTFEFTPEEHQQLEKLVEQLGDNSKAEVVRKALNLYQSYIDHRSEGYGVYYEKDGKEIRVLYF